MTVEFQLPEIGEGVVEGEIVEWHVAPGDAVEQDAVLVSVLTDKATIEIHSQFSGTIVALNGEAGDSIEVGSPLLSYSEAGAPAPAPTPAPKNVGTAAPPETGDGEVMEVPLPEIGEGVIEGEVVEWHVAVGDVVEHDHPIVSVLTDKATIEITSPVDGEVLEIFGESGEALNVGQVIMRLRVAQGTTAEHSSGLPKGTETLPASPAAPVAAAAPSVPSVDPSENPSISSFGTPLATPAVRRLAAAKGLDLMRVVGSGPNHRILREDVERAAAGASAPAPAAAAPVAKSEPKAAPAPAAPAATVIAPKQGDRREKIKGLRKAIHASMTRSKSIIPHFTYVDEVEMDKLMEVRASLKEAASAEGIKITYLPFMVKAVVQALKQFPILNASVDDSTQEIVFKGSYNIGIAVATPNGLTVPVVKHADQKTILEIAADIAGLSERARNRRTTMEDLSDGTFTITSLGRLGGLMATPVINHPEVGILGIHNLQERAVVRSGQIVIRQMMNISLSCDHRVVDGDVGASFAQEVKGYLENPSRLLLKMV